MVQRAWYRDNKNLHTSCVCNVNVFHLWIFLAPDRFLFLFPKKVTKNRGIVVKLGDRWIPVELISLWAAKAWEGIKDSLMCFSGFSLCDPVSCPQGGQRCLGTRWEVEKGLSLAAGSAWQWEGLCFWGGGSVKGGAAFPVQVISEQCQGQCVSLNCWCTLNLSCFTFPSRDFWLSEDKLSFSKPGTEP